MIWYPLNILYNNRYNYVILESTNSIMFCILQLGTLGHKKTGNLPIVS